MKNEDILESDYGMYTNLHGHSRFSALDGFSDVDEYVVRCKKLGMKGAVFSDHGVMSSAYELKKSCDKHGMKPIFANELYFTPNDPLRKEKIEGFRHSYHILLIAYNNAGYQNLLKLSSDAWTKYRYYKPRVAWEQLQQYSEGIICLSACFLPGESVLTSDGYQSIESVSSSVFNSDGILASATRTVMPYSGVAKDISFKYGKNIKCTDDHKFLLLNNSYFKNKSKYTIDGTTVYPDDALQYSSNLTGAISVLNIKSLLHETESLSNDLCFLLGSFAAEGHYIKHKTLGGYTYSGVGLTLHINEVSYRDKIISSAMSIDKDAICYFRPRPQLNRCDIHIKSKIIKDICLEHIGEYSDKKFISSVILKSSIVNRLHFISGYFYGDGYYRVRNEHINKSEEKYFSHEFTIATVSSSLAQSVCHLAMSCNIKMSCSVVDAKTDKNNVNHKKAYYLRSYGQFARNAHLLMKYVEDDYNILADDFILKEDFTCNGQQYIMNKIKSIDFFNYSGDVYCLSVPEKNSFVVNLSTVHNCLGGYMNQLVMEGKDEDAELAALRFKSIYKENFYLEMQWTGIPEQELTNAWMKGISKKHDIPLVITTDCHYIYKEDTELHRALVTINTGGNFKKIKVDTTGLADPSSEKDTDENSMFYKTGQYYLKPYHVLAEYFGDEQDVVAFANTNKIAEKCNVVLPSGLKIFPQLVPDPEKFIMDQCNSFIEEYCAKMTAEDKKRYTDRLDEESWIIKRMGYFDYFTVVQDMVKHAKDNDILVGLGRGSGASSLICFALGITGIDPLTYNLLFSRFLSSARAPYPLIELEEYPLSKWK